MIELPLIQVVKNYSIYIVGSTITSTFQLPYGMMSKSILGVEMVTNRDPNFQYVVQRLYLESTSTLYTRSCLLQHCVLVENNNL